MKLGDSTYYVLDSSTPQLNILAGGQVDGPNLGIPDQGGDSRFLQRFALQTHGTFNQTSAMEVLSLVILSKSEFHFIRMRLASRPPI